MSDKEVHEVKLVLQGGEVFKFPEGADISLKKRDRKGRGKEENKEAKGGIDIAELLESKKHPYRHLIFNKVG